MSDCVCKNSSNAKMVKTLDGSYFTPNKYCTYEKEKDGYRVVIICNEGAGFYKMITNEQMDQIIKNGGLL